MRSSRLKDILIRVHRSEDPERPRTRHQSNLEQALVTKFREQHTQQRRWLMLLNPWNKTARLAMIGLAMIILSVGACSTSTVTEVEIGQKVTLSLSATTDSYDKTVATIDQSKALDVFLRSQPDIENVSINVNESPTQGITIELLAWGQNLDGEKLAADLRAQVPGLKNVDIQTETLSGTFKESFASHLKHEIFRVEVDGATEEEIRSQVLAQLAEQGIDDGATVEVNQNDGRTEITIQVEEESNP